MGAVQLDLWCCRLLWTRHQSRSKQTGHCPHYQADCAGSTHQFGHSADIWTSIGRYHCARHARQCVYDRTKTDGMLSNVLGCSCPVTHARVLFACWHQNPLLTTSPIHAFWGADFCVIHVDCRRGIWNLAVRVVTVHFNRGMPRWSSHCVFCFYAP